MGVEKNRRYQIALKMDGQERVERFFDDVWERDKFIDDFEKDMMNKDVKFEKEFDHFVFLSFAMKRGDERIGSLTVYK